MAYRRRKLLLSSLLALFAIAYLVGPAVAGVFGIGDEAGPKIYPQSLHEFVYGVAWETEHDDGGPRLPGVFRSEYRPWFYGQYSKNDDPLWVRSESEKARQRLAADRTAG